MSAGGVRVYRFPARSPRTGELVTLADALRVIESALDDDGERLLPPLAGRPVGRAWAVRDGSGHLIVRVAEWSIGRRITP